VNKKWLSKLLVTAVLATSVGPVTAKAAEKKVHLPPQQQLYQQVATNMQANLEEEMKEAKISKEEALQIAQKAVQVQKDYKLQGINFYKGWNGNKHVWQISWYKEDRGYSSINVTVNAQTGNVVNVGIYTEKGDNVSFPPKVNYDQAVEIAKKYIQKMYPNKLSELVLDEQLKKQSGKVLYGDRKSYAIRFYQVVNNVPYYENNIMITINGNGEIRTFDYNWNDEVKFEKKENVISLEQAKKLLQDNIEMELRYQVDYSQNKTPKLIYVPKQKNYQYYQSGLSTIIDANTGEFLDMYGKPSEKTPLKYDQPLSEQATPLPILDKELTQKEAYEIVANAIKLPENLVLESANYEEQNYRGGIAVWSFTWRNKEAGLYDFIRAEVNAKTGEIISFYNDSVYRELETNKEPQVKYTKEDALKIASDFVKKVASDKVDRLYATEPQEMDAGKEKKPLFYDVYFYRKENGLPVQGQGVNITVSAETGKIVRFYADWRKLEFPLPKKAISPEKAKEIYLNDTMLALSYFAPIMPPQETNAVNEAILVYQPIPDWMYKYLDAVDGKWKDVETNKVVDDNNPASDIKGHKQEKELQAMIDYNVYDVENGKVYPNKIVTKGEFVEVVMRAIGDYGMWYNENAPIPFKDVKKEAHYYPYLQRAVDRKIIKVDGEDFHPDSKVTREFVAVTLVRALGYDRLASQKDLFTFNFKDANKIKYKGHVGLVSKLKIMPGTKAGEFQPSASLTRADMATIIYRFMQKYPDVTGN
jgi:uncharacterized membrane protein YkoI